MTKRVEDLLQRQKALESEKSPWLDHWQELAEVFLPGRADFTRGYIQGEKRTERIFDGTPMIARRGLSTAVNGLLKPKSSRWYFVRPSDPALDDDDAVKEWIEVVEERMWRAIYNPRAKFVQASSEVDDDLVTFGTGVLLIRESRDLRNLLFRSQHLRNISFAQSSEGEIDTAFPVIMLTPRQAIQEWGEENVGKATLEALKGSEQMKVKPMAYLRCVVPSDEMEEGASRMPFTVIDIDVKSEKEMASGGFHEFPWAVPRFDTRSEELYGRSAAMLALPDANTLQQMGKTILRQGHMLVSPPLFAVSDSVLSAVRTRPQGVTYVDGEMVKAMGGKSPVWPMEVGGNLAIGREMQQDVRDQIFSAFFKNVLNMPTDNPQMTATEILERRQEFLRTVGPVFDRLEAEYPAVIVRRVFRIMDRAGAFPERPEALREGGVRFEFRSPVQQARMQVEAGGLMRAFEMLTPLAAVQPEVFDHFDGNEIARDSPQVFGFMQKWLRDDSEVEDVRAQRAQQQQAMMMAEMAQVAGGVIKDVGQTAAKETEADAKAAAVG